MRLLLTVNSAFNLVNFRTGLIRALIGDGHRLVALVPRDSYAPMLEAMGCRVVHLEMDNKGLSPVRDAGLLVRIRRALRHERPDVVLGFTIKNNIYGGLAARNLGIPFLPNVTGLGTAFLRGGWLAHLVERLYGSAFASAPVVFFQNLDDVALFRGRGLVRPDQVRLLPGSGIDIDRFPQTAMPQNGAATTFLLIARMLRDKGVVEYADAARVLRPRYPEARFRMLGPLGVANRTAIGARVLREWVAEGIVDYLGTVDDVVPHIAAADCVVLPSYREGVPRTLLEAAAMARPIVATDVPGCREVVEQGVNGLRCHARDAGDLARAMRQMIEAGPEARRDMGLAGRRRIETLYDERIVIERYRDELASLAQSRAVAFDLPPEPPAAAGHPPRRRRIS